MTLSQFKLLDKDKRYIIWLAKSVEIASYEKDGLLHVLYQLDDFYIELQFVKKFPDNVIFVAFSDPFIWRQQYAAYDLQDLWQYRQYPWIPPRS